MEKMTEISQQELETRMQKNYDRLCEPYYQIENIFQEENAEWPGDKEGRALLAFVCHYQLSGQKIPCMELFIKQLREKTNGDLYFGPKAGEIIFEQQLSGHSWLLRGLCAYYQQFPDPFVLEALRSIFIHLYLPTRGKYGTYPIERGANTDGGVSGHSTFIIGAWRLSTDVGCAFMSIDGLAHYYEITRDEAVRELLEEMIAVFSSIDKAAIKAQTHCSLTAARGMLRLYGLTGEFSFLEKAKAIFDLYISEGMTLTYQNLNWWGRPDTWTEPCAIVDSLMVALELYKITREESCRTLAARIFHNGFATMQRYNGGAGPDSVVYAGEDMLYIKMYEAYFCCTMRLAEGLLYARDNRALLSARTTGTLEKDADGRYFDGDILYAQVLSDQPGWQAYSKPEEMKEKDGRALVPILKFYAIPDEITAQLKQKIVFR